MGSKLYFINSNSEDGSHISFKNVSERKLPDQIPHEICWLVIQSIESSWKSWQRLADKQYAEVLVALWWSTCLSPLWLGGRFCLRAVIWLKLPWSHVRRVMSSLSLPSIAGFLRVLRFPRVVTLDPRRVALTRPLGRTAYVADRFI